MVVNIISAMYYGINDKGGIFAHNSISNISNQLSYLGKDTIFTMGASNDTASGAVYTIRVIIANTRHSLLYSGYPILQGLE